ncbi:dTMP kinase [Candidatus Giovannonibacteria bacterium]|nr:dTMP kinase [Candidatus Giovannonibacteria bacterium]
MSLFIAFEGIDKSGKEAQATMLKEFLREEGLEVVLFSEPNYQAPLGNIIGSILRGETPMPENFELQRMYVLDRGENILVIVKPALERGAIVISDRNFLSTVAYGMLSGRPAEDYIKLHHDVLGAHLKVPDLTFYIDISSEECVRRMKKMEATPDFFERVSENQKKVRQNYLKLCQRKDLGEIYIVNGERAREEVFNQIKEIVRSKLNIKQTV